MCYDLKATLEAQLHRAKRNEDWAAVEEIIERLAPMTDLPLYHSSGFNHPELLIYTNEDPSFPIIATWGLIPSWIEETEEIKNIWNKTLNARGETIFNLPSFKESAQEKRCIIYVDGFYEHHHYNNETFPFFIQNKESKPLALAGLWNKWEKPNGGYIITFSIVTTKANNLMAKIHNNPKLKSPRMPFILDNESEEKWLLPINNESEQKSIKDLITPYPNDRLKYYTVSKLRGKQYIGNVESISNEVIYENLDFK